MSLSSFEKSLGPFLTSKRFKLSLGLSLILLVSSFAQAELKIPALEINLSESERPDDLVAVLKVVSLLTILSLAPAILLMMSAFTRILIVLSFVRQALGTQTMPPNQVIIGLSLFLTLFVMTPIAKIVDERAIQPYLAKQISQQAALKTLTLPIKKFMLHETRQDDLLLFYQLSGQTPPANREDVSLSVLMPAFMISELKTAFQIGFLIYIPFLVIDMVISSILMAMGMMMLPPTVVSLPFKLVLFVLVDGWSLIISSLMRSFQIFA